MPSDRWLVEISGGAATGLVVYAMPHAGGGAAAVKSMCRLLGQTMAAVAVRLPGRESRMDEPAMTDLVAIADELSGQIAAHAKGRSVLLYGHCAGAVFAYEVARRITPARLVVSSQEAPARIRPVGAWRLPRVDFLAQVAADGYLPAALLDSPDLLELVEPALRADYEAVERHVCANEVIDTPILALLGKDDHAVSVGDIGAWAELTSSAFELRLVRGGHNLLLDQPGEVATAIQVSGR